MIVRFFRYCRKVFGFPHLVDRVGDKRIQPHIDGTRICMSICLLFLFRLGSLNAWEELLRDPRRHKKWERLLGGRLPSADAIGYYAERVDCDTLREGLHSVYTNLQRNHHLSRYRIGGWIALAVDGHELFCSYSRHCEHCRQRTLHTKQGDRIQYYHSIVAAHLVGGPIPLLLDAEEIRPGEDEIDAAVRLLQRIQQRYPKAYEVLTADALYADPRIVSFLRTHNKHLIAVLKKNHPDLLTDVQSLCSQVTPSRKVEGNCEYVRWDMEGFSSWSSIPLEVRVVRSQETKPIQQVQTTSDWYWVTTFSQSEASTETVCQIGHNRWDIENDAFNYLHTYYHLDHCFHHHSNAILAFVLIAFWIYVLVSAFYHFNLKPDAKKNCCLTTLVRTFLLTLDSLLDLPTAQNPIRAPT